MRASGDSGDEHLADLLKPLPASAPTGADPTGTGAAATGPPGTEAAAATRPHRFGARLRRRGHYDRSVRPQLRHHPSRHPLHPVELLSMAWRTARLEPGRVLVPGLVIFGLDAFQSTWFTEFSVDHHGLASVASVVFFGVSSLGLTFYAGMLERLVGAIERNQVPQPVSRVLATLPWIRLVVAEALLFVLTAVATFFLVIPGLVLGTLLALVGPLINLLDCSVPESFRRSVRLVWPHFWLVFVMVTLPLGIEHEVVVLVEELVPNEQVLLVFFMNLVLGAGFGIVLGLIEVSLAERLISGSHGPGRPVHPEDAEMPAPGVGRRRAEGAG